MATKEVLIALQQEAQGQLDIFIQEYIDARDQAQFNLNSCDNNKILFQQQIDAASERITTLTTKRAELDEVILIIENSITEPITELISNELIVNDVITTPENT